MKRVMVLGAKVVGTAFPALLAFTAGVVMFHSILRDAIMLS